MLMAREATAASALYFRPMRTTILLLTITFTVTSCDWAGRKGKEALNKGGELAGSAATEVIEGVTTGVERTWKVDVHLSDALQQQGLTLGRTQVMSDDHGRDNRLVVYLSTERGLRDTLSAIAYDKDGLEMGRTRLLLNAPANSGDHYELQFQERTDLARKSRVVIR
jgi:hypothetical protein